MIPWLSRASSQKDLFKQEFYNIVDWMKLDNKASNKTSEELPRVNALLVLLQTVLEGFADEPESPQALLPLLEETDNILNADCSGIFTRYGLDDYILLASSCFSQQEELIQSIEKINSELVFREERAIKIIDDPYNKNINLIAMQLKSKDKNSEHILIVRRNRRKGLTDSEASLIKTVGDGFSAILGCAHKAQVNRRIALYEERAVIARELHDSLAQSLSYLKIQTSRLHKILNHGGNNQAKNQEADLDSADAILGELRTNINLAYAQLRELITTFRLTMNGRTLRQALKDSVEEFENKSSIAITLDYRLPDDELSVEEEMHVLQIVRECLSNIVRHAMASHAEIYVYAKDSGAISLIVDDDGIGIDEKRPPEQHQGLIIMQQRARSLGGEMTVTRSPANGTRMKTSFVTRNRKNINNFCQRNGH